jgi:membrane protease YdiL (CAAX protease family)
MISAEHPKENGQLVDLLPTIKRPIVYLAILVLAECLTAFVDPGLGLLVHYSLLGGLLYDSTTFSGSSTRRLSLSLTIAPLIRIVSLSLPLNAFDVIYWYVITAVPLSASILVVRRLLKMSWADIGLNLNGMVFQILIASTGVGLGYVEYRILEPEAMIQSLQWDKLILPTLIFMIGTGFFEEVLFRGIMQNAAVEVFSGYGIIYVSVIFAALHIGNLSFIDLAFVFGVSLFFGYAVYRTGSIAGVTVSHGLINVMLYLVFPNLMG